MAIKNPGRRIQWFGPSIHSVPRHEHHVSDREHAFFDGLAALALGRPLALAGARLERPACGPRHCAVLRPVVLGHGLGAGLGVPHAAGVRDVAGQRLPAARPLSGHGPVRHQPPPRGRPGAGAGPVHHLLGPPPGQHGAAGAGAGAPGAALGPGFAGGVRGVLQHRPALDHGGAGCAAEPAELGVRRRLPAGGRCVCGAGVLHHGRLHPHDPRPPASPACAWCWTTRA